MKFPFFASFIILCGLLSYKLKKNAKLSEKQEKAFWDRELEANTARRKPLTDLDYIVIPEDFFTENEFSGISEIAECQKQLAILSKQKIVNLSGYTNTDLKLAYGVANLEFLQEYDERFTSLCILLQAYASELCAISPDASDCSVSDRAKLYAVSLLEFAIFHGSDIYPSYELLVRLYTEQDQPDKITALIPYAEKIKSLSRSRIMALLQ